MSPEMAAEHEEAAKPFVSGCTTVEHTKLKSWRYFLEINSACNLRCPTCTKGNMEGYDHKTGLMDMDLMESILDKIKSENPEAIVFLYGNSEPFIHPRLPECIAAVKRRGLNAQLSTNMNYLHRVQETLDAGPDYIIISLSGFTQDVYVRGHAGGNIEKVKENMRLLSEANRVTLGSKKKIRCKPSRKNFKPPPTHTNKVNIAVNFHIYTDNQHEVAPMKEYALGLGFGFFTSVARAISMENAIQYCRHHDPEATPFEVQEGRPDWNHLLPPVGETYKKAMARLLIPPTKAKEMYADFPEVKTCPISSMFTFIRHDGKVSLCACVADRRISTGNYLEMSQDDRLMEQRGHSVCMQCQKAKLSYYFHIVGNHFTSPV